MAPSPSESTDFTDPTMTPRSLTSESTISSLPVWSARSVTSTVVVKALL